MRTGFMSRNILLRAGAALALAGCLAVAGLAQNGDGDLQASVAAAIQNDTALQGLAIKATISNRVVTLTGTVATEQQRQEAETVAAGVAGVAGIEDKITVTGGPAAQDQSAPPPPDQQQAVPAQNDQQAPPAQSNQQGAPVPQAGQEQMPPPPPADQAPPARQPYAARSPYGQQPGAYGAYIPQGQPQPVSGPVTIPAGTLLQIRTSEPLDTRRLQDGQAFQATAASDVFEGNVLAIPRGATIQGVVSRVKKPGALGGAGELDLQITSLSLAGTQYPLTADTWSTKGPNKAGYTAGNTVGGAVVGAIIGGAIGRGPGAAIGALAGGGAGMLASAESGGPRAILMPETLLNFHLSAALTVQPVSWQEAQRLEQSAPRLQRRAAYPPPYPYGYPYPYPYYRVYGW